jgi:Zn-dependent protease
MRDSIHLGHIRGIPVGVNWSLLAILGILTFDLAAGFPGGLTAAAVAVAALAAIGLFASVLVHELAHCVVALRNGLRVDGITLWLLGGVSRLEGDAPSPGAEFRIAVAGPALSGVLALGFGAVTVLADGLGLPAVVVAGVAWLAVINAVVAVFNLVPAAPLDGGRVLSAAIWARTRDRDRAELGAAHAGRGFGWLLVFAGIWLFLGGGGVFALWPALLGWFVLTAADAQARAARLRRGVRGLTVGDVMTPVETGAPGWLTVDGFVDHLGSGRRTAFVVDRWDGGPAGLVTLDALRSVPAEARAVTRVLEVAVPLDRLRTAAPDDDLAAAWARPGPAVLPHLMVRDGDHLVGVVSPDDVTRGAQLHGLRVGATR